MLPPNEALLRIGTARKRSSIWAASCSRACRLVKPPSRFSQPCSALSATAHLRSFRSSLLCPRTLVCKLSGDEACSCPLGRPFFKFSRIIYPTNLFISSRRSALLRCRHVLGAEVGGSLSNMLPFSSLIPQTPSAREVPQRAFLSSLALDAASESTTGASDGECMRATLRSSKLSFDWDWQIPAPFRDLLMLFFFSCGFRTTT